jgi:hypothetical protein
LIVLYDWLLTAAGTYGEFERLRMPINPIATVIVLGTLLLLLRLALKDRQKLIPIAALIAFEAGAIALLPHVTSVVFSELALLAIAAVHLMVFMRWSGSLTDYGLRTAPSLAEPTSAAYRASTPRR